MHHAVFLEDKNVMLFGRQIAEPFENVKNLYYTGQLLE